MKRRWRNSRFDQDEASCRADETRPQRRVERTRRTRAFYSEQTFIYDDTTQPHPAYTEDTLGRFQPLQPVPVYEPEPPQPVRRRRGCGCRFTLLLLLTAFLAAYLLFPMPSTFLVLGLDRAPEGTDASRTDTNVLVQVDPLQARVRMLSIPRDLWVPIPGGGENRINTAHYFAELAQTGSGPHAAMDTIHANFGIPVRHYIRIRFDGLQDVVDSMGGLTIVLDQPMSGYAAGTHTLDGEAALAFARDRAGSDDFFRMQRGQLVIRSALKQMSNPLQWLSFPAIYRAVLRSVDTNLPVWQLPRLGIALIRSVNADTLEAHIISREMVTPYTTSEGANVLLPDWDIINQLTAELFGG